MKSQRIIWLILGLIIVVNLPVWDFFIGENYTYSNIDGSFKTAEESGKGGSYIGCIRQYTYFLCQHPEKDQGDNKLYRTFTLKPWRFWEWREMIFHSDRFALPYLDPGNKR